MVVAPLVASVFLLFRNGQSTKLLWLQFVILGCESRVNSNSAAMPVVPKTLLKCERAFACEFGRSVGFGR